MKRLILLSLMATASLAALAADPASGSTGWITDQKCGAESIGNKECVAACIKAGSAPVFVDEDKKQIWAIDNPDAVKAFYGDHVRVTIVTDAEHHSVHIASIATAQ